MKTKLKRTELVLIASMLFGLFFGAGNLIFPIRMGQLAGANMWVAFLGLLITGGGNLAAGDGTTAILYSVVITLLIMCVMYTKQGIMTAKEFGDSVMKGVSSMMGLVILLVLSFSIGGVLLPERPQAFLLVVEHLDHLLPGHHLPDGRTDGLLHGNQLGHVLHHDAHCGPHGGGYERQYPADHRRGGVRRHFRRPLLSPFRYQDPVLHVRRHRSVFSRKNAAPLCAGDCGVHSGPLYRLRSDPVTAGCFRITVLDR